MDVDHNVNIPLLQSFLQKQIGAILDSYEAENDVNQLTQNLKRLVEKFDLPLDLTSEHCYNSQVCDEIYHGNLADLPWHVNAWSLDDNCSKPIHQLLTIITIEDVFDSKQIKRQYPDLTILKASPSNSKAKNEGERWKVLAESVDTPYVFVALNLKEFPDNWGNFERALRLLNSKSKSASSTVTTDNMNNLGCVV